MAETSTTTYTTAAGVSLWRRCGTVIIVSVLDTRIAIFPLSFLDTCGDNSWEYIYLVISLLIEVDPKHPGQLYDESGDLVDLHAFPTPGTFRYLESGQSSL